MLHHNKVISDFMNIFMSLSILPVARSNKIMSSTASRCRGHYLQHRGTGHARFHPLPNGFIARVKRWCKLLNPLWPNRIVP